MTFDKTQHVRLSINTSLAGFFAFTVGFPVFFRLNFLETPTQSETPNILHLSTIRPSSRF